MGDSVKFTTKDYNDNVQYSGTVVAICDYETARAFEDVMARHQAMRSTITGSNLEEDIKEYRFFIVECVDGKRRPFAFHPSSGNSWFENDEVEVIEPTQTFNITLAGCSMNAANIAIRILKEHGYNCSLNFELRT